MYSGRKRKTTRNIVALLEGSVTNKSPGGILSRLFRKILKDTNILYITESLIEKYEKNSDKDKSQIQAQICSEDMTWKAFCDSIVNLLNVKSFSITITLVHKVKDANGKDKVTVHTVDAKPNNSLTEKENKDVDKHNETGTNTKEANS